MVKFKMGAKCWVIFCHFEKFGFQMVSTINRLDYPNTNHVQFSSPQCKIF